MDRVTSISDRSPSGQGRGGANTMRGDGHRQAMADASAGGRAIHAIDDVTSVLGMPEGVLPAPVQARIAALMEEVERLRAELAQARRHEEMLRDLADHHPTLPVQHRRAFLRELNRMMAKAERNGLPGTLIYLHLGGIESLRESAGPEAAEAALTKAIEVLKSETDLADIVGYLDGGNFVVALALVTDAEAQARGQRLAERLMHMSFLWNGVRPVFTTKWSTVPFRSGEEADSLLRTADAACRGEAARAGSPTN
jgi:GGDEF domain-containing protein